MADFKSFLPIKAYSELVNQQYDNNSYDIDELNDGLYEQDYEIPEKIIIFKIEKPIDLTNITDRNHILSALGKTKNIKINNFMLSIREDDGVKMTIVVNEEIYRTPNGLPCQVSQRINFNKDSRFNNCSWANYFNWTNTGNNIPTQIVIDIVRWLQIADKLSCFL